MARAPKVARGALASGARHCKRQKKKKSNNNYCLVSYSFSSNNVARICVEKLICINFSNFVNSKNFRGRCPRPPLKPSELHAGALIPESGPHRTVVNSQLIAVANLWQEYDSVQLYQLLRHESVCVLKLSLASLARA